MTAKHLTVKRCNLPLCVPKPANAISVTTLTSVVAIPPTYRFELELAGKADDFKKLPSPKFPGSPQRVKGLL